VLGTRGEEGDELQANKEQGIKLWQPSKWTTFSVHTPDCEHVRNNESVFMLAAVGASYLACFTEVGSKAPVIFFDSSNQKHHTFGLPPKLTPTSVTVILGPTDFSTTASRV
jgi:hypothetical protein